MASGIVYCSDLEEVIWQDWAEITGREELTLVRLLLPNQAVITAGIRALLQPDELDRIGRYYRKADQNRFAYARAAMRVIAGRFMNQLPATVQIKPGINGKPMLAETTGWHINLSHAENCILLAIGRAAVGVDVERVPANFPFQDIVARSFSQQEQQYMSDGQAIERFYQLWTRKEALVKATAKGMDDMFNQLPSLAGEHHTDSRLLGAPGNWSVCSFTVPDAYQAAVAYDATLPPPQFFTIDSGLFG